MNTISLILITKNNNYYRFNGKAMTKHIVSDQKLNKGQIEHFRVDSRSFIEQMQKGA